MANEANEIFQHKIDKLILVYENDQTLTEVLKFYNLYLYDTSEDEPLPARIEQYDKILTVFCQNSTFISENTITELLPFLPIRSSIDEILTQSSELITDEMYRQFLYSYKYGSIKTFFVDNYNLFTPSYDAQIIQDNEKMKLWQEALMIEFDRFSGIIDDIIEIQDIDRIPSEYLDYIAQLVGYEEEDTAISDSLYREMIKNIIEIYRIKGTNFSFELFFNFIGYEIKVIEYYFDKRFYLSEEEVNPYTREQNKFKFAYYLTPNNPTDAVPDGLESPFGITRENVTSIRNGLTFDEDMKVESEIELERYLDIEGTPDLNMDYTYFKTNVVEYFITKSTSSGSIGGEANTGLTPADEKIISSYINFLTPIYIAKKLIVEIKPFEDYARVLVYYDKDAIIDGELTSMFKVHQEGFFSSRLIDDYNWNLQDKITSTQDFILIDSIRKEEDDLYSSESFLSEFEYYHNNIQNFPFNFTVECSSKNIFEDTIQYDDYIIFDVNEKDKYKGYGTITSSGAASTNLVEVTPVVAQLEETEFGSELFS